MIIAMLRPTADVGFAVETPAKTEIRLYDRIEQGDVCQNGGSMEME